MRRPMLSTVLRRVDLLRTRFEDLRWRAALHGLVLTRERRLLGAVYLLTPLEGEAVILYDLNEVIGHLAHRPTR
ncbi:hypothetical protein [Nocardiopsis sp. CC223A]|uniref:hypothetical protein n=1 Tax=Nocardiopsis sp. CC223A TaxID=3044051 RepID=UPI00278C8879|nr:hypothetical protein [Nocardiopsis sp. CC223A]